MPMKNCDCSEIKEDIRNLEARLTSSHAVLSADVKELIKTVAQNEVKIKYSTVASGFIFGIIGAIIKDYLKLK